MLRPASPTTTSRAYQHRKYLGPMDGYNRTRFLIGIRFLCQRDKQDQAFVATSAAPAHLGSNFFSPTLPSTHFALNPPSRIHTSPTNGKPTLHTHTASLPGPRGPGSHDSDLTRPARPSVPVTSPLDHSPMPGAHPPSALRVTTETLSPRPPWHLPPAQGTSPPPQARLKHHICLQPPAATHSLADMAS